MKVVAHTGLVPVTANSGNPAGVFGVKPEVAAKGVLDKTLTLFPIPEGVETEDAPDPAEPAPPVEEVIEADETVEIPEDWDKPQADGGLAPIQLMSLAKKISGQAPVLSDEQKEAGTKVTDLAKAIISEEVQRRAAAESQTE